MSKRIAWVSWEKVCRPFHEGGLGIKDIDNFNVALLSNWKWRLGGPKLGLWRAVLESRYGSWRELDISLINSTQSWWWRDLAKVCGKRAKDNCFDGRIKWIVGDEKKVKFWEDTWVGDRFLKDTYPRLFSISEYKESTVAKMGTKEQIKSYTHI